MKKKPKKSISKKPVNTVVCVGCGKETTVPRKQFLPDGWTFSGPDPDGKVEPVCDSCDLPSW